MGDGLTLGPKMEEVTAVCKKKKNCLTRGSTTSTTKHCEGDQIREDHMGGGANAYKGLVGKAEGNVRHERPWDIR